MIIYKTTNLVNNKIYIGQTSGKYKNYIGGGKYLKRAIKKYGKNNFTFEIIVQGEFTPELTDNLEKHYIQLYNTINPTIGYNISPGGWGYIGKSLTQEHKDKISRALKGKKRNPLSEDTRKKIGNANRGNKSTLGYKYGIEYKEACRQRTLGKKLSEETKLKMSLAKLGKIKSMETRYRMSICKNKPIIQLDMNNNLIKNWLSATDVNRKLGYNNKNISGCCTGKRKSAHGYKWIFNNPT